jgi:hypothetical protein
MPGGTVLQGVKPSGASINVYFLRTVENSLLSNMGLRFCRVAVSAMDPHNGACARHFVLVSAVIVGGFFFLTARCPRCNSFVLGLRPKVSAALGLPIVGLPYSIPKRCPVYGHDFEFNDA